MTKLAFLSKYKIRGVSMLEILLSFGILTFAVLCILGGMPAAAKHHRSSVKMNQALCLAQSKMDDLLASGSKVQLNTLSDHPSGDSSMVREWWGQEVASNPDLQQINVRVTWIEANGATKHIILKSCLMP